MHVLAMVSSGLVSGAVTISTLWSRNDKAVFTTGRNRVPDRVESRGLEEVSGLGGHEVPRASAHDTMGIVRISGDENRHGDRSQLVHPEDLGGSFFLDCPPVVF